MLYQEQENDKFYVPKKYLNMSQEELQREIVKRYRTIKNKPVAPKKVTNSNKIVVNW